MDITEKVMELEFGATGIPGSGGLVWSHVKWSCKLAQHQGQGWD